MNLPQTYDKKEFARVKTAGKLIQEKADVLVVIGIGGSYLGSKATIEALTSPFSICNLLKKEKDQKYYSQVIRLVELT